MAKKGVMNEVITEEEDDNRQIMGKGLFAAEKEFREYLNRAGMDSGYTAIRFTAWLLSTDEFHPLFKIEIDDRSQCSGEYIK